MRIVAIVQPRMGSIRLPNKVMKLIKGVPMIELHLSRLSQSKRIDEVVLATSIDHRNDPLIAHVRSLGYACEQGSEDDVLDRYVQAAEKHGADVVVRITGDCPLVDPELVDACIDTFVESGADYLCNTNPPSYPVGKIIDDHGLFHVKTNKPFPYFIYCIMINNQPVRLIVLQDLNGFTCIIFL